MGVKNLWKLLQESYCSAKSMDWQTMNGSIWAVDLSFWIVEARTAMQHATFQDPTFRPHLRNLFFRIKHLLSLGIRLIFVFDGAPPEHKFKELAKRGVLGNINRRRNKTKYSKSTFGRQCKECKQLLNILGVPFVDLKYGEAEAFASKLNQYGIVHAVLTPDGDSFLFGANKVCTQYQKLNANITCCDIKRSQLTQRNFVALGLLLGSDYCDGVKGIGHKRAIKLLESASREYGIDDAQNDTHDWLFHMVKWCEMSEREIEMLLLSNTNRKKNKSIEKFIRQIRETYSKDMEFLTDVIEAYLHPEFHQDDEQKLYNSKWLKWKCPDLIEMMQFAEMYLQMDLKNVLQHTLDIIFDLFLFGYVDRADIAKFEMEHIIKARVRQKVPMFSVQWKCNDRQIVQEILQNEELEGIKCEGLHWEAAMKQLQPQLIARYEESKAEKKKKPKARTKKKAKEGDSEAEPKKKQTGEAKQKTKKKEEKLDGGQQKKSRKKKKTDYRKGNAYYPQKVDWREPIDTTRSAMIYTQNMDELNDINDLLSSAAIRGGKQKQSMSDTRQQQNDENTNTINGGIQKRKKLGFKRSRLQKQREKSRKLLMGSSDEDEDRDYIQHKPAKEHRSSGNDSSEHLDQSLMDRLKNKKKKAKKAKADNSKKQLTVSSIFNDIGNDSKPQREQSIDGPIGWNCQFCTFLNTNMDSVQCEVCCMDNSKVKAVESEQYKESTQDISQLFGTLSISQSPSKDENGGEEIWDLTQCCAVKKSQKPANKSKAARAKKRKVATGSTSSSASIMNTSTSTMSWKCSSCHTMIPITTFVCPNCG